MSTKVVKLNQAEKMMTYLEIDKGKRRILVRFADDKEGWIPIEEIESLSPKKSLTLEEVALPNPYEIEIGTEKGDSVKVPWDFARHFCDKSYKEKEINKRDQGRSILGERIARARNNRGMTQEDLAEVADIGRVTISRLENGEQSPRYQTL
ncbi:MAG: helix-turn-helix domain-containing protein, partial [Candidatus Bipolaricaulia bacterium]